MGATTVHDVLARAKAAGLSWPLAEDLDDAALEGQLYPPVVAARDRALPDFAAVYRELKRRGVTRELLWQEYRQGHPEDGYGYSRFCDLYRQWRGQLDLVMRREHRAGEKFFVDYAGMTIDVIDPITGEVTALQVFVGALGASSFTYAEACEGQDSQSWIEAHVHAYEYIGGVAAITVPDNLKSGVTKPDFYEPELNPAYREMAEHYDTTIIPARARRPKDKGHAPHCTSSVGSSSVCQPGCELGVTLALMLVLDWGAGARRFEEALAPVIVAVRVAILVDREWAERESRSLTRRLQLARLRDRAACVEDVDFQHSRGLDRNLIRRLAACEWIQKRQNLIITGQTGCGKTYLASAFGHKACREGYSVLYRRVPRLTQEMQVARADGSLPRLLTRWAKTDVLILDDWGLAPLGPQERQDILEVIEGRHGERSTIIAAQLPVKQWHKYIGDPAVADAALDRIVHAAHEIKLAGDSLRKKRSTLTTENDSDN